MALNRLPSGLSRTFGLSSPRFFTVRTLKVAANSIDPDPYDPSAQKIEKISKAMQVYMEKAAAHAKFLKEKREEFELGKRHLANIMGWNPETITQDEIDEAIKYLFPTMLFAKDARPKMKPPEEIYPKYRGTVFDSSGRPFHFLFYTGKAKYYEHLHELFQSYLLISDIDTKAKTKGIFEVKPEEFYSTIGTQWLTLQEYQSWTLEPINEEEYNYLIKELERLVKCPYSFRVKDFISQFRKQLMLAAEQKDISTITLTEDGRAYSEAEGLRKHCKAKVRVYENGTGQVSINGQDLSYFDFFKEREQIMFPLQMSGTLGKVDIEATVEGVGIPAQAGAIRHGISLALRAFLPAEKVEQLRLAGLLTKDRRVCERKKYGQWAARRKFTWLKR